MGLDNLASMSRLDKLTLAIGEDDFGEVLGRTAHSVGDVDHVLVFALPPRSTPRTVVNAGSIDKDACCILAARYCTELYLLDPTYPQVRKQLPGEPANWFDFEEGRGSCEAFLAPFRDDCGVSDMVSLAVNHDNLIHVVKFLKTDGSRFASAQKWLLQQVGEVMAAHVKKHFSYMHMLTDRKQFMIGRILSESRLFSNVTGRERSVCVGILTGYTSESIALNLSISINSVLTYRKRAYEKLGITSQNELFARVIEAMIEMGNMPPLEDQGETMLAPFLQCMAETKPRVKAPKQEALADEFLTI